MTYKKAVIVGIFCNLFLLAGCNQQNEIQQLWDQPTYGCTINGCSAFNYDVLNTNNGNCICNNNDSTCYANCNCLNNLESNGSEVLDPSGCASSTGIYSASLYNPDGSINTCYICATAPTDSTVSSCNPFSPYSNGTCTPPANNNDQGDCAVGKSACCFSFAEGTRVWAVCSCCWNSN